jgi:glycosyltransferase involved in cell wall biosynthesis
MTIKNNIHVPAVSIGMPVYNGEKYIREALDSILEQTFKDFELIISDNCSTDKTQEICREYAIKDSRVKYIIQSENIGVALNFEFVLNAAQAKYFIWAASDDFWSNNWLELLHSSVSQYPYTAAFGEIVVVNQFSQTINHIALEQKYNFVGAKHLRRVKFFLYPESMGKANVIYGMYSTEVLRKINILSYIYDYILIFDLLNNIEIKSVQNTTLYKRLHDEAIGNQPEKINSYLNVLKIFLPMRLSLLKQYISHSYCLEKVLMVAVLPAKFLFIYIGLLRNLL